MITMAVALHVLLKQAGLVQFFLARQILLALQFVEIKEEYLEKLEMTIIFQMEQDVKLIVQGQ